MKHGRNDSITGTGGIDLPADTTKEQKETQKTASSPELILEMKGIHKSFPGVDVFTGFDFDLRRGEVHCICGENGAGNPR